MSKIDFFPFFGYKTSRVHAFGQLYRKIRLIRPIFNKIILIIL